MWNSLCCSIFSSLSPCLSFRDDIHVSGDKQETDRLVFSICCCCSVAESCLTLWDTMDCSMPGLPVLYYLLGLAQVNAFSIHSWKYNSTDQNYRQGNCVVPDTQHPSSCCRPGMGFKWNDRFRWGEKQIRGGGWSLAMDRGGASWETGGVCPEVLKRCLEETESHFTD